jgi:putative transposase
MFHSDRGAQFTSADFRKVLDSLHMVQSFSKKGHPYDNAVMECFFKYLKKQELDRRHFQSLDQLKHNLLTYIDGFYNPVRPHSHNHGLSPIQAENNFFRLTSLFYVLFPFPFYYFPFRYIESFCVHQFGKGGALPV